MIISTDRDKTFDKIQHLFMIKTQLSGHRGNMGFPGGSDSKESTCNVGDLYSIPGLGRSLGGGHGNLLQYSSLKNPHGRGAWRATQSMGSQRLRHD